MNEFLALISATIISFWGSLQLGPVNLCVIETALAKGKRQALMVAAGGIIPELIYSSIAVYGANLLISYPLLMEIFGWVVVLVLFGLGIHYLTKKNRSKEIKVSQGAGFVKGFLLAFFNPQLFPFWLGILVFLRNYIDFDHGTFVSPYWFFVLGTALGAWLLLYMFTHLAITYKSKLESLLKNNLDKIVGILFIILSLVELLRRLVF